MQKENQSMWPSLADVWKNDVVTGFLVSLLALPLCLGIASASGFPATAGVVTAIVGGVVCGLVGGAPLTIKGPAAGLIVIVVAAVQELGAGDPLLGYRRTLAVGVCVGVLQLVARAMRLGRFSTLFPSSVVHGMLAAIGVIIVIKQMYVLLGVAPVGKSLLGMLQNIPQALVSLNPKIALIGVLGLASMVVWPKLRYPFCKKIPAPVVVVLVALVLAALFHMDQNQHYWLGKHMYVLGPQYLLHLPQHVAEMVVFPDWSAVHTGLFWKHVGMVASVASIESLLTVKAVEKLDPLHRATDPNDDLLAVGCGNLVSSLLGGLPMISEIVRSSANVNYGAKSRLSNVFHGMFLAVFVLLCPGLLSEIPMAALASMLIYAGMRLASPQSLWSLSKQSVWHVGVAVATLVFAVADDLLVGIVVGMCLDFFVRMYEKKSMKEHV